MTLEEFNKLSPSVRGALWPRCKTCGHIAQGHDNHINEPKNNSCEVIGSGKCECCDNWTDKVQCNCKGYDGPKNLEALLIELN